MNKSQHRPWTQTFLFAVAALVLAGAATGGTPDAWGDPFFPLRVRIDLAEAARGQHAVDLSMDAVIEQLNRAGTDPCDREQFAFERAALHDPATGQAVGGFKLAVDEKNLLKDPEFAEGSASWTNFDPSVMRVSDKALMVSLKQPARGGVLQPVILEPGQTYLLQYEVYQEPVQHAFTVALDGAATSYVRELHPIGRWSAVHQLCVAQKKDGKLKLETNFTGEARLRNLKLRRANWRLIADLPQPSRTLDLYVVPRGGRKLTCPHPSIIVESQAVPPTVKASSISASASHVNPTGFYAQQGSVEAWSVPAAFPLRAEKIADTRPGTALKGINLKTFRGGTATALLAIDTKTPLMRVTRLTHTAPADVRVKVELAAPVPVTDAAYPEGKLIEQRLDALIDVNDPLTPPNATGVHVLAVTVTADAQTARSIDAKLELTIQTQEATTETLEVPLHVEVLPVRIKPMRHFETSFSGAHLGVLYEGGPGTQFTRDSTTVAQFHGYDIPAMYETVAFKTVYADRRDPSLEPVQKLAWKYYHSMLDYHLMPETLGLWSPYTYKVIDQGAGKAPRLVNWEFGEFDRAVKEFLVGRESPWFTIYRSNGHVMNRITLCDGVTYATIAQPSDEKGPWRQLPADEYFTLIGAYFDAIAKHLDGLGLAERALYVIDECTVETFETAYRYKQALKRMPHAQKIRFGHTAFVTDIFTAKTADGQLIMDEVLDVPMPLNDDHWNHFEPDANKLQRRQGKNQWVYYMRTDHLRLHTAGLSTVITPFKLDRFGARGWYCWASFIWSLPWNNRGLYQVNPWLSSWGWHDPGGLTSFYYPPDPRGPSGEPTDKLVPSYRLSLMRDGMEDFALLAVLRRGVDDEGQKLKVDAQHLAAAEREMSRLYADNPTQWYVSPACYARARELLYQAAGAREQQGAE